MTENEIRAEILGENWSWSALSSVAGYKERERRRILRSHAEEGFDAGDPEQELRLQLDQALGRLQLLELAAQIGLLDSTYYAGIPGLKLLLDSPAFGKYLAVYQYFGVRFVAGRIGSPGADVQDDSNSTPLKLPPPPLPDLFQSVSTEVALKEYLKLEQLSANESDVLEALNFLDDFVDFPNEQGFFRLWLRGLYKGTDQVEDRFGRLSRGMLAWASSKAEFYLSLERPDRQKVLRKESQVEGKWIARNPLAARFAICDLYWLSRLLGAEISQAGRVRYTENSWLELLAASRKISGDNDIRANKEVLRAALDITCDLLQNAYDIADEDERDQSTPAPSKHRPPQFTVGWRQAFDEELMEIEQQRKERKYRSEPPRVHGGATGGNNPAGNRWNRRACSGESLEDLVGLAFSGGGIRSATFNLGILQRLQELDFLRHVDYLSTVSGGGYIGAWLMGNVRRTQYWLSRQTNWDASIAHLRRFSNYLAPKRGALSRDTWTMWGTWVRNAALIQLTTAVWLSVLLVLVRLSKVLYESASTYPRTSQGVLVAAITVITGFIGWNFYSRSAARKGRRGEAFVFGAAAAPSVVGAFLVASLIWKETESSGLTGFGDIVVYAIDGWGPLLGLMWAAFFVVAVCSSDVGGLIKRIAAALATAGASVGALYLQLCALRWIFMQLRPTAAAEWYAFILGIPAVLGAGTVAVVVMIGLIGRGSSDWRREWWTRLGACLGIVSLTILALGLVTVFGPKWILLLVDSAPVIAWGTLGGWLVSVIGGLVSGNSSETSDEKERHRSGMILGIVARVAAFVFIAGAVMIVSTLLHLILLAKWTDVSVTEGYWTGLNAVPDGALLVSLGVLLAAGLLFSWRFDINIFGLNQFYRNRLVRCYLGATRWETGLRQPDWFTGFDGHDDLNLGDLQYAARPNEPFRGPFPIVNCALNLGGSSDLDVHTRRSAAFSFTPLRCGANRPLIGYAPTVFKSEGFGGGVTPGQAIAISGAAANPNMGFHTSGIVAFLLTMFNVRLGWWVPNPGRSSWRASSFKSSVYYLVKELFGSADEKRRFISVSDGGHFENLGLYELVRRRCKVIVVCDAEADPKLVFSSLGNVIRMCETDFGARIHLDISSIRKQAQSERSQAHCAVGKIHYSNGSQGYLIYLKSSITGDEDVSIAQYRSSHPGFPHESTADQFFAEDQFEAYRRLGYHVAQHAFKETRPGVDPMAAAAQLFDLWAPSGFNTETFVGHTAGLERIWDRFSESDELADLVTELGGGGVPSRPLIKEETMACLEMIQLMENVFLDLRLDDYWNHPDNRGWVVLFSSWARSAKFQAAWKVHRTIFGIRFVYFCAERLGLEPDRPVVRA